MLRSLGRHVGATRLALALACVVLAAIVAAESTRTMRWVPAATAIDLPVQSPAVSPDGEYPGLPPLEELQDFVDRPPFSPSRRPPILPSAGYEAVAVAEVAPIPMQLIGIFGDELRRVALVQTPGADAPLRLEEGQTLDGWTVDRIERDRIILESGAQQQEYGFPKATDLPSE